MSEGPVTDCLACAGPCSRPAEHRARASNSTTLLLLDDKCQLYAERNLHGRRWRHMRVYKDGEVKDYYDDMGPEDGYLVEQFVIPVADGEVSEWNTVGECLELAGDIHAEGGLVRQRKQTRPSTGREWADERTRQRELQRLELRAASSFGAGGHFQRNRDWRR